MQTPRGRRHELPCPVRGSGLRLRGAEGSQTRVALVPPVLPQDPGQTTAGNDFHGPSGGFCPQTLLSLGSQGCWLPTFWDTSSPPGHPCQGAEPESSVHHSPSLWDEADEPFGQVGKNQGFQCERRKFQPKTINGNLRRVKLYHYECGLTHTHTHTQ